MAAGRTISAGILTEKDRMIVSLCKDISRTIEGKISDNKNKNNFLEKYGKISMTRDAGAGRGGGKLQRDALCTRGVQGKAPFSNRNFRWHPLVAAKNSVDYAKEIERIEIQGDVLVFVIKDNNGDEIKFPSDKVQNISERYVVLPKNWEPHYDILGKWDMASWTKNSCVLSSLEACDWWNSVETYAVLGIGVAVVYYNVDFNEIYSEVTSILKNQKIDTNISLPLKDFPKDKEDITQCPLCNVLISKNPSNLPSRKRVETWKGAWRVNKRSEGEDSSTQIMHVNPLIESKLMHNAKNVRFGHRWCNVAMTDHSVNETLAFMRYIIETYKKD